MSFHNDYENWVKMSDPAHCPVCQNAPMPPGMVDIAEMPHTCLSAEPVECLKGACHVTYKKHAVELFELSDEELFHFMKEVMLYARALKQVTGAVKINYEVHCNTLPHLHLHLYPRYMDDPFPGQAINYKQRVNPYGESGFEAFVEAMRQEIQAGQAAADAPVEGQR